MADEIAVSRAEVAKLLCLPADTDDETLRQAMAELQAQKKAREADAIAASAEQGLQAEDKRIVAAAINAGKLPAGRADFWIDACKRDRARNRAIISMISPSAWAPEQVAVDGNLERVHTKVMAATGYRPTVVGGGAGDPHGPPPPPVRLDDMGLPLPDVPRPILIKKGVDPSEYTYEQRSAAFSHALGQRFSAGVPRPPAPDQYFIPSPNDPYEFNAGTGEFQPKPNNRAIPI